VGRNIRARRVELGLTQLQLSQSMFRHVQRNAYISLVEAGKVNMKLSTLVEFATNLSCQPYELLLTESSNTPQEDV